MYHRAGKLCFCLLRKRIRQNVSIGLGLLVLVRFMSLRLPDIGAVSWGRVKGESNRGKWPISKLFKRGGNNFPVTC